MGSQGKIYGLYHPQTGELRYVGQTWAPLPRRLTNHLYVAKRPEHHRRHVVAWIKSLLNEDLICRKLFDEKLSYAQVAEELGVPVAFLQTRLSRARRSGEPIPKFRPGPKSSGQRGA